MINQLSYQKVYSCLFLMIIFSWFLTGCSGPKPSLASTDPELRRQKLIELGRSRKAKRYLDEFTERLAHDPDSLVRVQAAFYLGKFKYQKAVPFLVKALDDKSEMVREESVRSLGLIADPQAIDSINTVLQNDSSVNVRRTAAKSLGAIGDPAAVQGLITRLEDEDDGVAFAALKALQEITQQSFGKDIEEWNKWVSQMKTTPE